MFLCSGHLVAGSAPAGSLPVVERRKKTSGLKVMERSEHRSREGGMGAAFPQPGSRAWLLWGEVSDL